MKLSMARVSVSSLQVPHVLEDGLARHRPCRRSSPGSAAGRTPSASAGTSSRRRAARARRSRASCRRTRARRGSWGSASSPASSAAAQQAAHAREQDRQLERLRQVVVRAGLEAPAARPRGGRARSASGPARTRPAARSSRDHREAVLARQHHVEHDRVEARRARRAAARARARRRRRRPPSWPSASRLKRRPSARCASSSTMRMRLTLDSARRARLAQGRCAFARGSSSVKVAPLPSPSLCANTRPPWRLAIDRTM